MKRLSKFGRAVSLSLVVVFSLITAAGIGFGAEKFPSRAVVVVVPFTAGGPQDAGARVLAEYFAKELGVPVLVENHPDAGGVKGVLDVYKAKPDGYLLLSTLFPRTAQTEIVYKTPYKTLEMTYLAAFNQADQLVVVNSDSPYKTFKDLVEASKKKSLNCGLPGLGSLGHLNAMVLKKKLGMDFELVPFKGGAPQMMALLGGHVDFNCTDHLTTAAQGDKVRSLAITSEKRSPKFPNVPTFKELGLDIPVMVSLQGLTAPPGLPEEIRKVLSDALARAIKNPEFMKKMDQLGPAPIYMAGPEFKVAATASYKLVEEYKELFVEAK
jgi:tripartite-type tricarboxylate transporter receptor subunit TctC